MRTQISNCGARSSGVSPRFALYSGSISLRKLSAEKSNMIAACDASVSARYLISELAKP